MTYNKKIWANGDLITKERMNNIEDGIYNAHDNINVINNKVEDNTTDTNTAKQDISDIKLQIGTEELTTTSKKIKGAINDLSSQIEDIIDNKSVKTDGVYDFVRDFGGKPNDETFDNSIKLKEALEFLNSNKGGRLMFGSGIYEFKTPIEIDALAGVILEGVSFTPKPNKKGAIINYTGTGFLLTVNTSIKFTVISKLTITSATGSFFTSKGSCTYVKFYDLYISNVLTTFKINKSAYVDFQGINAIQNNSTTDDFIVIGKDGKTEYMNFYSCAFGGAESMVYNGVLCHVFNGFVSFHNCDFPNTLNTGLLLEGIDDGARVHLYNCNFTRCKTAIDVYANTASCNLIVNNTRIGLECKDTLERGIVGRRINSKTYTIMTSKLRFRFINNDAAPEYLIYTDIGSSSKSIYEYYYDNTNSISEQCKVLVGNKYTVNNIKCLNDRQYTTDTITADSITTDFDFILSTNSPYATDSMPYVHVTINTFEKYYWTVSNTNGGELKVTVKFENAPTNNLIVKIFRDFYCVNKS